MRGGGGEEMYSFLEVLKNLPPTLKGRKVKRPWHVEALRPATRKPAVDSKREKSGSC